MIILEYPRDLWKKITTGSANRKIFGAAVTIAALTIFVKVIAMSKELVVAASFGVSDTLDAFLIAVLLPTFFSGVVANSFNAALIPTYIQVRDREGREAAQQLFSKIITFTFILFLFLTICLISGASFYLPWIAHGFSASKLQLTLRLLLVTSPFLVLSGLIVIFTAILNAEEKYAFPFLTPAITPFVTLLFLLLSGSMGIYALVAGLIIGLTVEMLLLGGALRKRGILLRPKWGGFDPNLLQVTQQFLPMIAGAFIMSSSSLVDQAMAAMLPSGSVAALSYSNKLIAFPLGLAATALGTSVIPSFSKMTASGDLASIRHILRCYLTSIFLISIPLMAVLFILARPLVQILFQRGYFGAQDAILVTKIFCFHVLQIPFYIATILLVRLISALKQNHFLMVAAIFNCVLNIMLNYGFMKLMGIAGIALSTSCVYLFSFVLTAVYLRFSFYKKLKEKD